MRGFEKGLEDYIFSVAADDDPGELEDAAVLVGYSVGAKARGLLELEWNTIATWRDRLLRRIRELLRQPGISPGRKCSLMRSEGLMLLFDWTDTSSAPTEDDGLDASKAIAVWRKMIREVRHAPMFPLESFCKLLAQLAGRVRDDGDFSRLVAATDGLLSNRFGKHKLAEQAFERAQSYYRAGKILEAIDELHKARVDSLTEEKARNSVEFSIFLAKMYAEVGLHFAAKYYALGAAFAALKLDDDSLKARSYRGLAEAASSDHASGASMEFFLTAKAFLWVSHQFSMSGSERTKQFEWSRIDFYSLLLTRAASYFDEPLHVYLKGSVLESFGADEIYEDSSSRLDDFFDKGGLQAMLGKAAEEGIMPPFSDVGPRRRVGWRQLGINWFIDWANEYDTAQAAEGFCSALQILLADLRNTELSILPSDVFLSIDLHDGKLKIVDVSDNEKVALAIHLPNGPAGANGVPDRPAIAQGVAASALGMVSAMSRSQFIDVYEARFRAGLGNKLSAYAPFERLFREFYSPEDFADHYLHASHVALALPQVAVETNAGLSGPTGLHPQYDQQQSEKLIGRRYAASAGQLAYTLPRLVRDSSFLSGVRELRREGWKDWHVLQAAGGIRLNYMLNATLPAGLSPAELTEASRGFFGRDEKDSDPEPPASVVSAK